MSTCYIILTIAPCSACIVFVYYCVYINFSHDYYYYDIVAIWVEQLTVLASVATLVPSFTVSGIITVHYYLFNIVIG